MIENNSTVRKAASVFNISKSTVHKDISVRLKSCNIHLYKQINALMEKNKKERHIRGGMATKLKYLKMKETLDNRK